MDDERDLPARLRLPESFAESGDPIEGNPTRQTSRASV